MKFFFPEEEIDFKECEKLSFLGISNPTHLIALYLQNQYHAKNSDRKTAFSSKKHKNPFILQEAEQFII